MIQSLKFQDTEESKLFVTGCPHLGHKREFIWQTRGYNSPEEHTKGVVDKINETCRPTDKLLILGDFCLNTPFESFLSIIKQIQPELIFLRGNHNNSWEKPYLEHCKEKFGYEVVGYKWLDKITYLGDYVTFKWNGQTCIGNHYPYYVYDGIGHGIFSLVSHSHGTCELTLPSDKRMKQLDCGWCVHKKPLSFKEIKDIMDSKGIPEHDRHDKNTTSSLH